MPVVRVKDNEGFDTALRRFKRICEKAGLLTEMRRHEFFEKPTWKRKRRAAAAKKRQLKRLSKEKMMPARGRRRSKDKKRPKRPLIS